MAAVLGTAGLHVNGSVESLGPIVNQANGWAQSEWLGWHVPDMYPYVLHAQHEWLYAQPQGNWIWLYDYALKEWFATSRNTYPMLYEPLGDNWMWYYEGSAGPRWYADVQTRSVYRDYNGALMPNEMVTIMSQAEDLTSGGNEVMDALSESLGLILMGLLGDTSSTCPMITRVPADLSLAEIPETFGVTVDFGAGCVPGDSDTLLAGLLQMDVNGFALTDTGLNLTFSLEALNLTGEGELLLDGSITGGLNAVVGNTVSLSGNLNFNNLRSLETTLGGAFTMEGTVANLDTMENLFLTLGMSNVNAGEYIINSGTLTIDAPDQSFVTVSMVAETTDGPVDITLFMATDENDVVTLNTDGMGTVMGHSLQVTGLVIDPMVCPDYPIAGVIRMQYEGKNFQITFDDRCDGSYLMQKGG